MQRLTFETGALLPEDLMSTTQQRKRGHKLATILEDSRKLMQRDGYAAFTLRKAAAEAGVPLGTLQHYFPTREVLLKTVIHQTLKQFNDEYHLIARSGGGAADRLTQLISKILTEVRDTETRLFMLEVAALANHEDFATEALAECYQDYIGIFASLVAEINPNLSKKESHIRAVLIVSQLEGLLVVLNSGNVNPSIDGQALDHAVHVVVNSLSTAGN
ncbi:transcriptional regulator, TetR family [Burkholderia sp. GAS332]|nr:transcriptional regulator, TetR family [Burkholderia sp. GAS332]